MKCVNKKTQVYRKKLVVGMKFISRETNRNIMHKTNRTIG